MKYFLSIKIKNKLAVLSVPQWGNYLIIPNNKYKCDNIVLERVWSRINWSHYNLSLIVQNKTKNI